MEKKKRGRPKISDYHTEPETKPQPAPGAESRRTIVDTKYKKRDEEVHFNFGFMPSLSYRCLDCRAGFVDWEKTGKCLECGSMNITEHSKEPVR